MRNLPTSSPRMPPIVRGLLGRCPRCGEGRMFRAFLKVSDRCEACGEELHHHRADDFPAYVVILIVGHVLVPLVLYVETHFAPSYWTHLALWLPTTLALTIGLLQPVKGAIVALQWSLGMHGFAHARENAECSDIGDISTDGLVVCRSHQPAVMRQFDRGRHLSLP